MMRERYQAGESALHQLDPRVKVIVALLLITGIVLMPDGVWPVYPLVWALVGGLAALAQIGPGRLARLGMVALPFALAAVTLLVTTPGETLLQIGGLTITVPGVERFLSIMLKSWLAAQVALLMAITTPFTDLLWALGSLGLPEILVAIIGFMYRYLFTLQDEAARLLRARSARSAVAPGYHAGGTLLWRARVAGQMIGSLFLRSMERSERVYQAMLARGYNGRIRRLDPPPLTLRDVVVGTVPVIIMLMIRLLARLLWSG